MPDPVSGTGQARSGIQDQQFSQTLDSPVKPGNDKSPSDNSKFVSPIWEGFQPSPMGKLTPDKDYK